MVYKRYIKRDGKKYGPYLYKSFRNKEGKVISKIATEKDKKNAFYYYISNKNLFLIIILLLLFGILLFTMYYDIKINLHKMTGYSVYSEGINQKLSKYNSLQKIFAKKIYSSESEIVSSVSSSILLS